MNEHDPHDQRAALPPARNYQRDAINNALAEIAHHNPDKPRKSLAIAATGLGKTRILAGICEELLKQNDKTKDKRPPRVLVLSHLLAIHGQLADSIAAFGPHASTTEHGPGGAPMTLFGAPPITITTAQTAARRLQLIPRPSVILIDEAHRTNSRDYRAILQAFPAAHVVGFTATPHNIPADLFPIHATSTVCHLPISWGIAEGWLVQPATITAPISTRLAAVSRTTSATGQDYDQDALDTATAGVAQQIAAAIYHAGIGPTIVFSPGVRTGRAIAAALNDAGRPAGIIEAITTDDKRQEHYAKLRNEPNYVLINYGTLLEGFDAPTVRTVVVARATRSRTISAQMVGRGLRPTCHLSDHMTADQRRAAIAASDKPVLRIIQFIDLDGAQCLPCSTMDTDHRTTGPTTEPPGSRHRPPATTTTEAIRSARQYADQQPPPPAATTARLAAASRQLSDFVRLARELGHSDAEIAAMVDANLSRPPR